MDLWQEKYSIVNSGHNPSERNISLDLILLSDSQGCIHSKLVNTWSLPEISVSPIPFSDLEVTWLPWGLGRGHPKATSASLSRNPRAPSHPVDVCASRRWISSRVSLSPHGGAEPLLLKVSPNLG